MATSGIKPSPTFNKSLLEMFAVVCFELRWVLTEKGEEGDGGFGLEVEEVAEESMEGSGLATEIAIFGVREISEDEMRWLYSRYYPFWMRFVGIIKLYLFRGKIIDAISIIQEGKLLCGLQYICILNVLDNI